MILNKLNITTKKHKSRIQNFQTSRRKFYSMKDMKGKKKKVIYGKQKLEIRWLNTCVHSHVTLWDSMDCSPTGSSVHGISQARTLEWVAISYFRGSSWPRDQTESLASPVLVGGFFTTEPQGKPQDYWNKY